jgi:hypothetical protein
MPRAQDAFRIGSCAWLKCEAKTFRVDSRRLGNWPETAFEEVLKTGAKPDEQLNPSALSGKNGTSGASAAFGGSSSLSSFGYYAERTVHCFAVRKQGSQIGLNHHQVGSSGCPAIVLASNAAPQLRKIILRSKVITLFSCRFLLHTVFARSSSQGAR